MALLIGPSLSHRMLYIYVAAGCAISQGGVCFSVDTYRFFWYGLRQSSGEHSDIYTYTYIGWYFRGETCAPKSWIRSSRKIEERRKVQLDQFDRFTAWGKEDWNVVCPVYIAVARSVEIATIMVALSSLTVAPLFIPLEARSRKMVSGTYISCSPCTTLARKSLRSLGSTDRRLCRPYST